MSHAKDQGSGAVVAAGLWLVLPGHPAIHHYQNHTLLMSGTTSVKIKDIHGDPRILWWQETVTVKTRIFKIFSGYSHGYPRLTTEIVVAT